MSRLTQRGLWNGSPTYPVARRTGWPWPIKLGMVLALGAFLSTFFWW